MNRIRVKFSKHENIRYISHLDLMRVFERAIRRANVNVVYSNGFNPKPSMIFGAPLAVGATSDAEYADFDIEELTSCSNFKDALNDTLPDGIMIIECACIENKSNIMASIAAATYEVTARISDVSEDKIKEIIDCFMNEKSIYVKKQRRKKNKWDKKVEREIDIRPMIRELRLINDVRDDFNLNIYKFCVTIATGSKENLNPSFLFDCFFSWSNLQIALTKIHRTKLFVGDWNEDNLYDPLTDWRQFEYEE